MALIDDILAAYPELKSSDFDNGGIILLQNDADGLGDYIKSWDYSKAIPDGMKLGK